MFYANRRDFGFDFAARDLASRNDFSVHHQCADHRLAGRVAGDLEARHPHTIFPGNVDTMPIIHQGDTNGCGTTSLAMITCT